MVQKFSVILICAMALLLGSPLSAQEDSLQIAFDKKSIGSYEQEAMGVLRDLLSSDSIAFVAFHQYLEQRFTRERNNSGWSMLSNFDGLHLYSQGLIDAARKEFHKAIDYAKADDDLRNEALNTSMLGNLAYFESQPLIAIDYWLKSIQLLEDLGDTLTTAKVYINIGAAYVGMEYFQSSYQAFENATRYMNLLGFTGDEYHIATINKAVACMSLKLIPEARTILAQVPTEGISSHIRFLLDLNYLVLAIKENNKEDFQLHEVTALERVTEFQQYKQTLQEVLAEGYMLFDEEEKVRQIMAELVQIIRESDGKKGIHGLSLMQQWYAQSGENLIDQALLQNLVVASANWSKQNDRVYLYEMLAKDASSRGRYQDAYQWQLQAGSLSKSVVDSAMYTQYHDFATAFRTEQLEKEREAMALLVENKDIELTSNRIKSLLLTITTAVTILLLLLGGFFWRKQRLYALQQEQISRMEMTLREQENQKLQQDFKTQEIELQQSKVLLNLFQKTQSAISPILESVRKTPGEPFQQELKELQYLFYELELQLNNLEVQSNISQELEAFVVRLRGKYNSLTEMEATVCGMVRLGYSSKEIAELLKKTEKSIENYRTRGRQKMDIDSQISLIDFLKTV